MITSYYRSIRRIAQHVTPGQPWKKSQKELAMITTMSPSTRQSSGRRGVVLIVVLAMLGLLAVIGVTFATYSNQAQIASRRFIANTKANVDPDSMLNYALEQLINDSNNRLSSLRGHSLKRDMYGNDSVFHGVVATVPNVNAAGFPKPQLPPTIRSYDSTTGIIETNIPVVGTQFDGYDFTRWILKASICGGFDSHGRPINQNPNYLTQTVEVLDGSYNPKIGDVYRRFRIANPDLTPGLSPITNGTFFSLDGRYLRSFNGAGVTHSLIGGAIKDWGVYPNMRLNTVGNNGLPNGMPANPDRMDVPALDEDYDAADLENWFLALQSADGSITLPSFHRPGIIEYDQSRMGSDPSWYLKNNDWNNMIYSSPTRNPYVSAAKFLRPRAFDGNDGTAFPDLVPDLRQIYKGAPNPTYGQIGSFDTTSSTFNPAIPDTWNFTAGYDVDNDGDGYEESVWMDLGFPVQTDANGKKYKPLYSFLVLGLNGRLPLNTAGNLHDRTIADNNPIPQLTVPAGSPTYNHTSHLGTSPSEINLNYALRHTSGGVTADYGSKLALRGLLAGRKSGTDYVEGRWGDKKLLKSYDEWLNSHYLDAPKNTIPDPRRIELRDDINYPGLSTASPQIPPQKLNFDNPVKPGKSILPSSAPSSVSQDASDDDGDVFDFLSTDLVNNISIPAVPGERFDAFMPPMRNLGFIGSRNLLIGVERERRFVTPIDPVGTGRVLPWNRDTRILQNLHPTNNLQIQFTGTDTNRLSPTSFINQLGWYGTGADEKGRVGYFGYYRAPGLSVLELPNSANAALNIPIMDTRLNTMHGFWSFLNPIQLEKVGSDTVSAGGSQSAMPFNIIPTDPRTIPTFNSSIASSGTTTNAFITGQEGYKLNRDEAYLLNRDEADEQNLYEISDQFDSPFRSSDLADLYLKDSSYDDSSEPISSRIVNLNGPDETLQITPTKFAGTFTQNPRKFFSVESWDTNRFSWSTDNPGGAFAGNSWFGRNVSASTFALNAVTPSIATGDRRINLNFPIPPYDYRTANSLDPLSTIKRYDEPTRLKWLSETFQLMLSVLPPLAIDHPLEKVQLAQYLVNVIDFRDPDSVMTRFSSAGHGLYESTTTPGDIVFSTVGQPAGYGILDLWGMEYNPIAINEVLAYEYKHWGTDGKSTAATPQNRIYIELINTLTASQNSIVNDSQTPPVPDPSDLKLERWKLVSMQDADGGQVADRYGRPDPVTGQIFTGTGVNDPATLKGALGSGSPSFVSVDIGGTLSKPFYAKAIRQSPDTSVRYTVLSNPDAAGVEIGKPNSDYEHADYGKLIPPVGSITDPKTEPGRYFWLYLMRPADLDEPDSRLVVVDSIRFPYMVSTGEVTGKQPTTNDPIVQSSGNYIYSSQRLQPFRGGHAVPNALATSTPPVTDKPYFPMNAYGYSEQTTTGVQKNPSNHFIGDYGVTKLIPKNRIYHSINTSNTQTESWSQFSFNDRDFQSVAELMMVPGCGPGQFTKLFIEDSLPLGTVSVANNPYPTRVNPADPNPLRQPTATVPTQEREGDLLKQSPPSFPYLVDKFYFTGAKQSGYAAPYATIATTPSMSVGLGSYLNDSTVNSDYPFGQSKNTAIYGGPSADGWHRMLEFFEVPSSMNGAIGPVTEGENGDWFRQTRVPGKLNLNLIVDEEVFMGLVDDPRINLNQVSNTGADSPPFIAVGRDFTSGNPIAPTTITNRGYVDATGKNPMHQAFSDFLKIRHGGSGTMLAFGSEPVGSLAAYERPYRSLSYPDINFTILRPANLPPSGLTNPVLSDNTQAIGRYPLAAFNPNSNFDSAYLHNYVIDPADKNKLALATPNLPPYLGDPGVRNIFMDYSPQFAYAQPPITPTRRLFQISDAQIGWNPANLTIPDFSLNSNAGFFGNPMYNQNISHSNTSIYSSIAGLGIPKSITGPITLSTSTKDVYPPASLFMPPTFNEAKLMFNLESIPKSVPAGGTATDTTLPPRPFLGANVYQRLESGNGNLVKESDRRQHPFFRTELLQKVMNLTTVRTQQFAVYVTVGFFEVKKEGNANTLQPDILGAEIDPNNRYTMFAVVDRSKAEGFNPINPGNFRQLVDYSRRLK